MIVIESGGSKSTWVFEPKSGKCKIIETVGLHPQEITHEKELAIQKLIDNENLVGHDIYFYGAGCESLEAKSKITLFLESFGLKVKQVQTDAYAACITHLGDREGVVGIIGTGAVAARFDGQKVIQQTSGLGYILGDEGSGFDIGKRLLKSYFNNALPDIIQEEIKDYFNHQPIVHRIHEPDGRKCIAGLTKIVYKFRSEESIHKILSAAFTDFFETALQPLNIDSQVYFIGSIAFYFEEELKKVLQNAGVEIGGVKKEAVVGVYNFLSKKITA